MRKLARGLLEIPGVAEIRIWEADCMRYVRSGLCVLGLLLSYAASARAESLTKVGLVLNFAADGGSAGFYQATVSAGHERIDHSIPVGSGCR